MTGLQRKWSVVTKVNEMFMSYSCPPPFSFNEVRTNEIPCGEEALIFENGLVRLLS